jgi:hypothetical protein
MRSGKFVLCRKSAPKWGRGLTAGTISLAAVLLISGCGSSTPSPAPSVSPSDTTTVSSSLLPPLAVTAPGEPADIPSGPPACGGALPTPLNVSADVANLVSACGGIVNGAYAVYFSNLSDAVLDVTPVSVPIGQRIYPPLASPRLIPFTWDDAEEYIQTQAEQLLTAPPGEELVPVGGAIELESDTPVQIQVQADEKATAESRASELMVDYVVDNLKEEVPRDSVIGYTTAIADCVNAGYSTWTSLNQEDAEAVPDTITTAMTTYQQCQDLQEKLKADPASELHVAAVHPVDTGEVDQDLSKVADDAGQDKWPRIVSDLVEDGGRIVEDLHP